MKEKISVHEGIGYVNQKCILDFNDDDDDDILNSPIKGTNLRVV